MFQSQTMQFVSRLIWGLNIGTWSKHVYTARFVDVPLIELHLWSLPEGVYGSGRKNWTQTTNNSKIIINEPFTDFCQVLMVYLPCSNGSPGYLFLAASTAAGLRPEDVFWQKWGNFKPNDKTNCNLKMIKIISKNIQKTIECCFW